MGNPLQDRRTATEWASVRQVIEFEEIIESFSSLAEVVEQDLAALEAGKRPADWRNAPIRGRVEFGYADTEGRIPSVQGVVTASVDAVCQRCLEPFRLELEVEPRLLLLDSEDTVAGFEEFDVWELDERLLRPHDIVEELLTMALPFAAMHDNRADCRALTSDDADTVEETVKPFAALREQMERN